jgi:hypothetical protein
MQAPPQVIAPPQTMPRWTMQTPDITGGPWTFSDGHLSRCPDISGLGISVGYSGGGLQEDPGWTIKEPIKEPCLRTLWERAWNIEFMERKLLGYPKSLFLDDVIDILDQLPEHFEIRVPHVNADFMRVRMGNRLLSANPFERLPAIITKLLKACDGHLHLCGGSVFDTILGNRPNDYDLFVTAPEELGRTTQYGCDVTAPEELGRSIKDADACLKTCMKILDRKAKLLNVDISVSSNINVINIVYNRNTKIQIIKRLYTCKEQILDGFDLPGCRMGFNNEGFFTNISGATALVTLSFPIDTHQITTSHGSRIMKYNQKGYNILLLGIPHIRCDHELTACGLSFKKSKNEISYRMNYDNNDTSDYDPKLKSGHYLTKITETLLPDRDDDIFIESIRNNPQLVKIRSRTAMGMLPVEVLGPSQVDVSQETRLPQCLAQAPGGPSLDLPGQVLGTRMDDSLNPDPTTNKVRYTVSEDTILYTAQIMMKTLFLSNERLWIKVAKSAMGPYYEEWVVPYVLGKKEEADIVWNKRLSETLGCIRAIAENMIIKRKWKVKNPGDQFFGKNNPLPVTPQDFYGSDYIPTYLGISNDRYVALRLSLPPYTPSDIINIIMREWLVAEYKDIIGAE